LTQWRSFRPHHKRAAERQTDLGTRFDDGTLLRFGEHRRFAGRPERDNPTGTVAQDTVEQKFHGPDVDPAVGVERGDERNPQSAQIFRGGRHPRHERHCRERHPLRTVPTSWDRRNIQAELPEDRTEQRQHVVVAGFASAIRTLALPILRSRVARLTTFALHEAEDENALRDLRLGEVDIALTQEYDGAPPVRSDRLTYRPLLNDRLRLIAPPEHPPTVRLEQLAETGSASSATPESGPASPTTRRSSPSSPPATERPLRRSSSLAVSAPPSPSLA
jgi:LysR substrate binding domain